MRAKAASAAAAPSEQKVDQPTKDGGMPTSGVRTLAKIIAESRSSVAGSAKSPKGSLSKGSPNRRQVGKPGKFSERQQSQRSE